jgi:hypothetical protein
VLETQIDSSISSGTKWYGAEASDRRSFHVLLFTPQVFLNLHWIAEKMQGLENDRRGRFQMKLLGIAWLAMGVLYVFIIIYYLFVLQCWSHPAQKGWETSGVSCTLSGAASHATADERSREPRQPRGARKAVFTHTHITIQ